MANPAPLPWSVSVIQLGPNGKPLPQYSMGKDFGNWLLTSIVAAVAAAPQRLPVVNLSLPQSASIGVTAIPLPALATGAYRLTWYLEKTVADGVSSAVQVTLHWTHNAKALSISGANLTLDTITAVQSDSATVLIDSATPISYSVTYASNTPGAMKYILYILPESV